VTATVDEVYRRAIAVPLTAPADERATARADLASVLDVYLEQRAPKSLTREISQRIDALDNLTT